MRFRLFPSTVWIGSEFGFYCAQGADEIFGETFLVKNQSGPGSVWFGYGLGVERFDRFRFSVPAVPLQKGFSVFQYIFKGKDGSGSGFGYWKTVPAVPVPLSVSGKTVLTVPVSRSATFTQAPRSCGRLSVSGRRLSDGVRELCIAQCLSSNG